MLKNVRVWFSKTGAMRYISHLDLTRCMGRAIKRAGLPVWYTQGFNPRIYMNFAMPLSLGVSGERECMDLRLETDGTTDLQQMFQRFASYLPQGVSVWEVTEPELGFEEIAFAEYELWMETESPQTLYNTLKTMLRTGPVIVMKHGKRGDKPLDIQPFFEKMEAHIEENGLRLQVKLPCTQNGSVNPGLLAEALKNLHGCEPYVQITRKRLLAKDLNDMR
ncbi:TIGR03936 family radical SAM-associated protein [Acutalibacter caecimuris]|uniref:TIGR03936 family radical SAM-associated protein n=1 Tax=Acutalibacter caecimuris TaxID=3093657 RepID=UPI002AC91827|nr:TIGR03936 family radical SAM-associated protein [Acutalibacter sp. M00118]